MQTTDKTTKDIEVHDPDMLAKMELLGFEPIPMTPAQLAELIRVDTAKYADLVRRTGASAD